MLARKLLSTTAPILVLGAVIHAIAKPAPRPVGLVGLIASASAGVTSGASGAAAAVTPLEVVGTQIRVRKADGAFASNEELVGSVLVARGEGGIQSAFRVDFVEPDPKDPSGETLLYAFSAKDPATGVWASVCKPDAAGLARGFPLAGVWTPSGEHVNAPGQFEITCTSGAIGKCVRMGYKPWTSAAMWDRHQACVRMVRADYCGDGTAHTRDGTAIDVYDAEGIQKDEPAAGMSFEAGWGKDGAVCVSRTRVPAVWRLEQVRAACPARLEALTGAACTEERAKLDPRALLFNKS